MYTCAERDHTENQRIKKKYKGTEGVSGKRGRGIGSGVTRRDEETGTTKEEDATSNEGRRVIR